MVYTSRKKKAGQMTRSLAGFGFSLPASSHQGQGSTSTAAGTIGNASNENEGASIDGNH